MLKLLGSAGRFLRHFKRLEQRTLFGSGPQASVSRGRFVAEAQERTSAVIAQPGLCASVTPVRSQSRRTVTKSDSSWRVG